MKITTYMTLLSGACLAAFAACQSAESGAAATSSGVELGALTHACRSFAVNNGDQFPESLDLLVMKDSTGAAYIEGASSPVLDVWGAPYEFELLQEGKSCRIKSYGRDGVPGGKGDDKDASVKLVLPRS